MIAAGIVLLILGAISTIAGITVNNDLEIQLEHFWNTGRTNPGTVWIVLGVVALAVGIVLLILGITKKNAAAVPGSTPISSMPSAPARVCRNCGGKLADDSPFCPNCGASTAPARPKPTNVCLYCESIIPPGAGSCPACGKPVGNGPVGGGEPTPKPDPKPPEPGPKATVPRSGRKYGMTSAEGWSAPGSEDL